MGFLLHALAAWAVSALILLITVSFIISRTNVGTGAIGYISSAVSFLTALFAGSSAARRKKNGGLYAGLLAAAAITTLLLTIGFLVDGPKLESSGVLSVVTFTFSGSLVGSVFFVNKTKRKKTRFEPKLRK